MVSLLFIVIYDAAGKDIVVVWYRHLNSLYHCWKPKILLLLEILEIFLYFTKYFTEWRGTLDREVRCKKETANPQNYQQQIQQIKENIEETCVIVRPRSIIITNGAMQYLKYAVSKLYDKIQTNNVLVLWLNLLLGLTNIHYHACC